MIPPMRKRFGMIIHLISVVEGTITRINHISDIESLQSFVGIELSYDVGDKIVYTTDIRTDSGYVLLCNDDDEKLQEDFKRVVDYQYTMFDVTA